MSELEKPSSGQDAGPLRTGAAIPQLSPLVIEALKARGLSDEAIRAVMKKHRKPGT